jgi:NAD(P)-dependent dehydrogenase (short-subunit alcohol dehydrogenase family)
VTSSSRTILLTGATAGVGRALVDRFAEAGHVVLGCGRRVDVIAELGARHPAPHAFASVDVSDAAAVDAWAAELLAAGHVPDLVLNNAAIMNTQVPVWEVGADEMERMLAVNVGGIANVVRAFVPAMIEAGRGVVVNLSSGWGRSTSPHVGPYCATKHAVEGLSGSLSQELPSGLACVALSPGVIDTDMLRTCLPDVARETDGAEAWSHRNADYLLSLGPQHNGQSLSVS